MNQTHLRIVTPKGVVLDKLVDIVTVRTIAGYIGILHGHIPFVSTLVPSTMSYREHGKKQTLHISGGIIQSNQEYVRIISDNVETDAARVARLEKGKRQVIKA